MKGGGFYAVAQPPLVTGMIPPVGPPDQGDGSTLALPDARPYPPSPTEETPLWLAVVARRIGTGRLRN